MLKRQQTWYWIHKNVRTRNYILTQEFKVRGNYPGQRTQSYATIELKNIIEKYIEPIAGKITDWPMYKEGEDVYNGAFQYTTSSSSLKKKLGVIS